MDRTDRKLDKGWSWPPDKVTDQRRRILFLISSLEGGGAERVFVTLLRHLGRDAFELHLGLLKEKGPYLADLPSDVIVHNLKVSRVRYSILAITALIWRLRPAVVVSSPVHLNFVILVSKLLWPPGTALLVRESTTITQYLEEEKTLPRFWMLLYRWLYHRADHIVCQSRDMYCDFRDEFSLAPGKLMQIYNPVDCARVQVLAAATNDIYEGPGPNLIASGRLANAKGFDLLLEAMTLVGVPCPAARLTILGDGPLRKDLEKRVNDLGLASSVRFLGFQENPFPYYREADLFILTSKYEGLPNAMLETIALGTPVLATDCVGGVREIVDLFPELCFLCERTVSALASAILRLSNYKKSSNGSYSQLVQSRFESTFGISTVVRKYKDFLQTAEA